MTSSLRRCAAIALLLLALPALAAEWLLVPQPRFLAHKVTRPIPGTRETVLAVAKWTDLGFDYASAAEWEAAPAAEPALTAATRAQAAEWVRAAKPELIRSARGTVEYARVFSDKVPVAAAVLAPEFLAQFRDVFGPKVLLAMPNLYTVYVFPGVASRHADFGPLILDEAAAGPPRVSTELFELSADGLRAVGVFER